MEVSLAIITLNAADSIEACLRSVMDYVEEVCILDSGSTDDTLAIVRRVCPKAKIEGYLDPNRHPEKGWTSDFSALRNRNFAMCSKDAILWVDADDTVVNPRHLRATINDTFKAGASALSVLYVYGRDAKGHPTSVLPRHRVVRRGYFEWEGPVHEDLKPLRPCKVAQIAELDNTYIDHKRHDAASPDSAARNLWILEEYQKRGGAMNDRLHQNVATSLVLLGRYEEALEHFRLSLEVPHNNPETDYITHLRAGDAYLKLQRPDDACQSFQRANLLFPDRKTPYLALAEVCVTRGQGKEAMVYVTIAENMHGDESGFVWNPTTDSFVPAMVKAKALTILEDYHGALAEYDKLSEGFPDVEEIQGPRRLLQQVIGNHKAYSALMTVYAAMENRPADQATLLSIAPPQLKTFPEVARRLLPDRPTDRKTVAIYCGPSHAVWGHDSIETGIGGSEEAVVLLSRELVVAGWHVEVYAFPSADQMGFDPWGVFWTPYYTWDASRFVDVYIGWREYQRQPRANAAVKALWLHDSVIPEYFSEDMTACWDVIFALSKHHAAAIPLHAQGKVVLTANGLNHDYFVDGKNSPHAFIYASSPDRGLLPLLQQWGKIKEAIPDATLDVYYGFTRGYMIEASRNPELRKLKADIEALQTQSGVYMHGMVGQRELAHAFARSGFWLYPTAWSETSCAAAGTLVQLPCDRSKHPYGMPIEQLVGRENFPVYAYDPDEERFVLANCTKVWETGVDRECVDIELDDGSVLTLTPDHKVMDFDGEWHEAATLTPGMRLNALHMRYNVAYKDVDGDWRDEHRLVGEWQMGRRLRSDECVDHLELTRLDNSPERLRVMSLSEHSRHTHSTKGPRRKKSMAKQIEGFKAWAATPDGQAHFKAHLGNAAKGLWAKIRAMPETERKAWTASRAAKKVASVKARAARDPVFAKHIHDSAVAAGKKGTEARWNHKVVAVRPSAKRHTVYDMEVDRLHNFVAGGVVVHNCITGMKAQALGSIPITSRHKDSAIPETCKFDLGPAARDGSIYANPDWLDEWAECVMAAASTGPHWTAKRAEMKAWARQEFSWSKIAAQWSALFSERLSPRPLPAPSPMTLQTTPS